MRMATPKSPGSILDSAAHQTCRESWCVGGHHANQECHSAHLKSLLEGMQVGTSCCEIDPIGLAFPYTKRNLSLLTSSYGWKTNSSP